MPDTLLANTLSVNQFSILRKSYNGTIGALAAFGVFMAEVMVAVDGTRVVTAPTFQGRGKLAVTEYQRNRQGLRGEVIKLLYGWRLIACSTCAR